MSVVTVEKCKRCGIWGAANGWTMVGEDEWICPYCAKIEAYKREKSQPENRWRRWIRKLFNK